MDDGGTRESLRRGLSAVERGEIDEARDVLEMTARSGLPDAATVQAFGALALRLGRPEVARSRLRREIRRFPRDARLRLLLGRALDAEGALPAAAGALRDALRLRPGWSDAAYNLAIVLERQGRLDEAVATLETTLREHPDDADLWNQLGLARAAQNRREDALLAHRRAHASEPDDPDLALNLGLELLAQARWEEGWPLFEHRLARAPGLRPPRVPRRWSGESLEGRRILVWNEQGLGDTLFATRWLAELTARGAEVVLRVQPVLRSLLARLDGVGEIFEPGQPEPPADFHAPLLSLPGLLGIGHEGPRPPLAIPDPGCDAEIPALEGGRPRVGLVWAGNPAHTRDRERSIDPRLLRPLLDTPGATFVSLQYGEASGSLRHRRLQAPGDEALGDFSRTAGWMRRLDLIVTVDTAAAHLAGTLGRPVWTLLSRPADWRWGCVGDRTPWYPTMRLFRQPAAGDWQAALARLQHGLAAWRPRRPEDGAC